MRSRRDSAWKAGLREAPGERWALEGRFLCRLCVTVRKKPGTPLGVGKRLVLGVGLASPLPSCPLDKPGQKAWGQDGVSAPGTPSFAPLGRGGRSRARRGSQSTEELSPRGRGGSRRLRPDGLANPGQEGQVEGRLSDSPQRQWAAKETLEAFPALTSGCPSFAPSGGGGGKALAP